VRKPEGKRPLGKSRRRWEDNIKMDLQEVVCTGMDWIEPRCQLEIKVDLGYDVMIVAEYFVK
jgi:hypothetical protein